MNDISLENKINIAARMRAFRVVRRLTLSEVAAMTGVSVSYLSELERGIKSPTIAMLEKIYAAYDTKIRITYEISPL